MSSSGSRPDAVDEQLIKKKGHYDSVKSVLLLNCSMAGIQFTFAIMSTLINPYMTYLNISQAEMTAASIIGPVCGFVIQPIFGSLSDNCKFKYGRRRIYILGGALFIILSLCFVGYGYIGGNLKVAQGLVFTGLVLLNISINVMLCPARAIVSDLVSSEAQNKGQVYAAFMMGASFLACNFIVYGLSFILNPNPEASLESCENEIFDTSDMALIICSVGIGLITLAQVPTMIYAKEEQYKPSTEVKQPNIFVLMAKQIRYMPGIIKRTCLVFFGSWAGYYPFQMFCSYIFGLQVGALANAIGSLTTLVFSLFLTGIIKKLGEKVTYTISQGIAAVAMISMVGPYMYVHQHPSADTNGDPCTAGVPTDVWWIQLVICVLVALVGINNAVMNSIPFGIVGKCGGEAKGLYMGILNCCCVLAQAFGILINLIWQAIFPKPDGPDVTPDNEQVILSEMGYIVVCAVCSAAAFGFCFLLRNPNSEEHPLAEEVSDEKSVTESRKEELSPEE